MNPPSEDGVPRNRASSEALKRVPTQQHKIKNSSDDIEIGPKPHEECQQLGFKVKHLNKKWILLSTKSMKDQLPFDEKEV